MGRQSLAQARHVMRARGLSKLFSKSEHFSRMPSRKIASYRLTASYDRLNLFGFAASPAVAAKHSINTGL